MTIETIGSRKGIVVKIDGKVLNEDEMVMFSLYEQYDHYAEGFAKLASHTLEKIELHIKKRTKKKKNNLSVKQKKH